jgi:hypothetical protein
MGYASKGERSGEIVAWEQFSVKKFFWPQAISAVAGSFDCVRLAPYFAQDDKGVIDGYWRWPILRLRPTSILSGLG